MKKLLIIFVLIIFASCEKDRGEEQRCYVCQWKTAKYDVAFISEDIVNIEKCNVTPSEIFAFEAEKTKIWTAKETTPVGTTKTVRYESTCNCVLEP